MIELPPEYISAGADEASYAALQRQYAYLEGSTSTDNLAGSDVLFTDMPQRTFDSDSWRFLEYSRRNIFDGIKSNLIEDDTPTAYLQNILVTSLRQLVERRVKSPSSAIAQHQEVSEPRDVTDAIAKSWNSHKIERLSRRHFSLGSVTMGAMGLGRLIVYPADEAWSVGYDFTRQVDTIADRPAYR